MDRKTFQKETSNRLEEINLTKTVNEIYIL
jgi:hypothetical protein